ncbi:tryptophan-rich sensory protein [Agromyces laixinhei]|uniref:tryptophan-rich sensory protein n=1 Tax=Agromyces laixinhei TaxID=2585717 RepID=UPI0012ED7322|nr:tryptophan-rich sensory protein [Agromyces laixinhei]
MTDAVSPNVRTTGSDLTRQLAVAASALVAVVGAFIGSGAAGGTPIQDAAGGALAADATLIAPGTGAFTIWTLIYFGLLAYAVWQFLPGQRTDARHRSVGYPIAASLVLNAAWILSIQFDLLWLSVPIIVALLVVLIDAFRRCLADPPKNLADTLVTDGTVGLYLGWVCVATAANATAALIAAGFEGWGIPSETWAVVVIAGAGAVGVGLAVWDRGRIAPMLSLGWGLSWVAIARFTDAPASVIAGVAAIVAVAAVVAATVVARTLAHRRKGRT